MRGVVTGVRFAPVSMDNIRLEQPACTWRYFDRGSASISAFQPGASAWRHRGIKKNHFSLFLNIFKRVFALLLWQSATTQERHLHILLFFSLSNCTIPVVPRNLYRGRLRRTKDLKRIMCRDCYCTQATNADTQRAKGRHYCNTLPTENYISPPPYAALYTHVTYSTAEAGCQPMR